MNVVQLLATISVNLANTMLSKRSKAYESAFLYDSIHTENETWIQATQIYPQNVRTASMWSREIQKKIVEILVMFGFLT